jgi:YbbR domain-containing protein
MPVREFILNNFWLKLFSLVLAVMIWLAIRGNIRTQLAGGQNPFRLPANDQFARPIMLMTSGDDHQAYVVDPLAVNVKVTGDSDALNKLNPNDIQVFVRLNNVMVAHGAFPVEVKLPRNITLQTVWPSHVHVEPAKAQ